MPRFLTSPAQIRSWSTPLTIASFVLMSATGVLMFFEINRGLTTVVHQWFSWLFLIGVAGHIFANNYPFVKHLKTFSGKTLMLIFASILVASQFSWGLVTGPQLEAPIKQSLVTASVSTLAELNHISADGLIRRFGARGINVTSKQTVQEIATNYKMSEKRILAIAFLPN